MLRKTKIYVAMALLIPASTSSALASDDELAELKQQLLKLQKRITQLEQTKQQEAKQRAQTKESALKPSVKVGGAVRTTFSHTSYDDDNKNRGGDFELDVFRINFSGNIGGFGLNAEWRYFDYMTAVKFAYLYYDFAQDWQAQVGLTKVPFGNWPYNSHSWFFGTTYYVGLEDDHDMGVLFKRKLADNWQLDLGFFKNDELGGVDGYVEDRSDRYSYDIVGFRNAGDGIYDDPNQAIGEYNTFSGRYGYHFEHEGGTTELGVSGLMGDLHNGVAKAGDYHAWAVHLNANIGPWNFQLQHGEYDYSIANVDRIAVGAYAFYDSIAAQATMSNINIAYSMKVKLGPINSLQFYNDFGIIYDKSDHTNDTWMNVTGVSMSAGAFFSYLDFVNAKNQPFVGGSIAGDSDDTERRFNLNFGYYF
ncbi:carbohydrate porin [Pseudoalteromonas sp. SMS1]|uniref:carbohydrate porin n=1 Tax=Pseudoalteromonas sp. SMS1 TaxID=2908894 RepID=UPI001F39B326|nr:carbohydrate porin [Pseudoalteromonas sp. SMS1]MCF2859732.1 carbohydrate porin [Pseudoalteromonas sp. SMS1]